MLSPSYLLLYSLLFQWNFVSEFTPEMGVNVPTPGINWRYIDARYAYYCPGPAGGRIVRVRGTTAPTDDGRRLSIASLTFWSNCGYNLTIGYYDRAAPTFNFYYTSNAVQLMYTFSAYSTDDKIYWLEFYSRDNMHEPMPPPII